VLVTGRVTSIVIDPTHPDTIIYVGTAQVEYGKQLTVEGTGLQHLIMHLHFQLELWSWTQKIHILYMRALEKEISSEIS
jgi:hypothetical protein